MRKGEPVIQMYMLNGKIVLRSATKNAKDPSEAQKDMRQRFKEIAKKSRGMKMTGDMPPAAEIVAQEMKGQRSDKERRKRKKVWEEEIEEISEFDRKVDNVIKRLVK